MVLPLSVTSEYTKKNLLEMQKALHHYTARLFLLLSLCGAFMCVVGWIILGSVDGAGLLIFAGLLWTIIFLVLRNQAARKSVRASLKSHMKIYGKTVTTTIKFYNTMLIAHNDASGAEVRSAYEDVQKLVMTRNLLVFVLLDKVALMMDRRNLDPNEDQALWELLMEGCINAKVYIHK